MFSHAPHNQRGHKAKIDVVVDFLAPAAAPPLCLRRFDVPNAYLSRD